jgi:hypothetical protein
MLLNVVFVVKGGPVPGSIAGLLSPVDIKNKYRGLVLQVGGWVRGKLP